MESLENHYRGYNIFSHNIEDIPSSSQVVISTINQYSFCIAEEDPGFKKALIESDILLPDGIGIVIAVKTITGHVIKKITGADIHRHSLEKLNNTKGKCFYLGSSELTLAKIKKRLGIEYPNIECEYYSPPFKADFSECESQEMVEKINAFAPDVLFVGMTAPKQEKWVNQHKKELGAKLICSIGAVFDFYGGTVERPSEVWIRFGLEWFIRLCKEPKRMWKRYIYYGPIFIYILFKEKLDTNLRGRLAA